MPYLRTNKVRHRNKAGHEMELVLKVQVNTKGEFYAAVPVLLELAIASVNARTKASKVEDMINILSDHPDKLVDVVGDVLKVHLEPEVKKDLVILYNIESHVSFAETPEGVIFPNAGFEDAEWQHDDVFGRHHASCPAEGGYSLTIGAKAFEKTTFIYGDKSDFSFKPYYGEGVHLDYSRPAGLLNSWCSFSLPDDPKEIPYSDKAALFFHELMLGMAGLSRRVQELTADKADLLGMIDSGSSLLMREDSDE